VILVHSDLVKLKRNPELQARYDRWNIELKEEYGTVGEPYNGVKRVEMGKTDQVVHFPPTFCC
jgi:hypothetical protein